MPHRNHPRWHYQEAERLLASVTRFTGFPLDAVDVEVSPQHEAICREALIHAVLAIPRPAEPPRRKRVDPAAVIGAALGTALVVALVALIAWVV